MRVVLSCLLTTAVFLYAAGSASAGKYDRFLPAAGVCAHAEDASAGAAEQEHAMRCLINYARRVHRTSRLQAVPTLRRSAQRKASTLLDCGEFSHTPCGQPMLTPFRAVGYTNGDSWAVGENLAWMSPAAAATPRKIMRNWLESTGHRRNLLSGRWQEQGLERRRTRSFAGARDVVLWVSHFGRRR